jgi:hypothetical protein
MPNDWRTSVRRQRSSVKTFETNRSAGAAKFDPQAQAPDMIKETSMHTYLDEGHENYMWRATGDLGGSILFVHELYLTYCSAKSRNAISAPSRPFYLRPRHLQPPEIFVHKDTIRIQSFLLSPPPATSSFVDLQLHTYQMLRV